MVGGLEDIVGSKILITIDIGWTLFCKKNGLSSIRDAAENNIRKSIRRFFKRLGVSKRLLRKLFVATSLNVTLSFH
ncbi:MAG: hypothetical protein B6247_25665 [Candidatus Parabeggiatoa sp. nov. 2]|nr:MAG: hypothetical protein B6247_25665 [Beggiatoa sp. 4572_84]